MLKVVDERDAKPDQKVAVIGSGISGLSAAWLLDHSVNVTLFEADSWIGGHANTVEVVSDYGTIPVDTGFIVYNDWNYPNLVALFEALGVTNEASDMSFAASLDHGAFEYSGTSLSAMIGQKSNIIRLKFWKMVADILRFYRKAPLYLSKTGACEMTLGEYLDAEGFSKSFVNNHILPMGAAIWSTTAAEMRSYPLVAFIRFFESHGLLSLKNRPVWRTVTGGSREYIKRILADFTGEVRLNAPVATVRRVAQGVEVTERNGKTEIFDKVVIASHADQARSMLVDTNSRARDLLENFKYTHNTAVLHSDISLMPKRKQVWSSWNYIGNMSCDANQQLCVTYWMNRLQNLDERVPLFVTLNPNRVVAPGAVHASFDYTHPLFDHAALSAQKALWQVQGQDGVWFCGAYFGSGFHEDGLQSGLAVAEMIGGIKRPWKVGKESGRIHLSDALAAAE
jgi:uncharacterized protein